MALVKFFDAIDRFYRRNAGWLFLGMIFAGIAILWDISSIRDDASDALSRLQAYHDSTCTRQHARLQRIEDLWAATARFRSRHGDHEKAASVKWTAIADEARREHIGSTLLEQRLLGVAGIWVQLSNDDYENAKNAVAYAAALRDDYDTSCKEPVPTPRPPFLEPTP